MAYGVIACTFATLLCIAIIYVAITFISLRDNFTTMA